MARSLPIWMLVWFVVASLVVIWDGTFVMNRPRSMPGGDLHQYWSPYAQYIEIDRVYADMENPWTVAQTLMNFPEVGLQFAAVVLALAGSPAAVTVAFTVSIMTFWKTVAYNVIEYCEDFKNVRHNETFELVFLYIIPNWIWIIVPGLIMLRLYARLTNAVAAADDYSRVANTVRGSKTKSN